MGVCIDTCHAFTAGYNLKDPEEYEKTWTEFDSIVGFNYLRGIHLNDSKKEISTRVDRHDNLGKGYLGIDFFKRFMADKRFDNMPIILETPDETLWKEEIALLKEFAGE